MQEEISAARGIVLGVLSGAAVWIAIAVYIATVHL
jgi:hypothetical protein